MGAFLVTYPADQQLREEPETAFFGILTARLFERRVERRPAVQW